MGAARGQRGGQFPGGRWLNTGTAAPLFSLNSKANPRAAEPDPSMEPHTSRGLVFPPAQPSGLRRDRRADHLCRLWALRQGNSGLRALGPGQTSGGNLPHSHPNPWMISRCWGPVV